MKVLRWSVIPLALLAGCGSSGEETGASSTSTSIPDQGNVLVIYSKSGGIAGMDEQLTIERSGAATLTSRGAPSGRFQLTPAELSSLTDTLDAAPLDSKPTPTQTGCADCFEYSIAYGDTTLTADEVNLPGGIRPAIAALDSLITKATVHK